MTLEKRLHHSEPQLHLPEMRIPTILTSRVMDSLEEIHIKGFTASGPEEMLLPESSLTGGDEVPCGTRDGTRGPPRTPGQLGSQRLSLPCSVTV